MGTTNEMRQSNGRSGLTAVAKRGLRARQALIGLFIAGLGGLLPCGYNSASAQEAAATQLQSGIALENFSPTVKAGDDFFEHVNGKWLSETEIPADRAEYGIFGILDDETQIQIRAIIEEASKVENPKAGTPVQQVGDLYRSYVDLETRNKLRWSPIQDSLKRIESLESNSGLGSLLAYLSRQGVGHVLGYGIEPDARNSDAYIVYLGQSGTTLPDRDYYLSKEGNYPAVRAEFEKYIAAILGKIGHADAAGAAKRVLEFETAIAQAQWTKVENRDPVKTYNKVTGEDLAKTLSHLPWTDLAEGAGVGKEKEFVVAQPSFLEAVDKMAVDVPLATWKDYLTFHVVDNAAPALSEEFEAMHFKFHETTLSGATEQLPLWKRGVETCNGLLGMVVGKIYVEKHFSPVAKERMKVLVGNLTEAFKQRIDGLEWMGKATKLAAHEKLSKFTTKIGYPDRWKDYSSVRIDPKDLVGNLKRVTEFEYQYALNKLGAPIDRTEWFMTPQMINAYYNPLGNEIVFPAAILQPPFFNLNADDAANYGGIGAVIGHELSHGFDDQGRRFDGKGNLRNWWTQEDLEEFEKRAKKLVEQYSKYKPFEDMSVNGELTLGENIGDLGGLSMAYTAYQLSLGGKPAPVIDGFTGDQRFFLSWSQAWRRKYREPELRRRLVADPHSPSKYRVIGIVSNMDAFYKAFDIKPTDKMYIAPENRVRIW